MKLPAGLDSKDAASLMCGGAIMWEVLASYDMKPGERIGVHGVGGLGHVAILMSSSVGCDVIAYASTESKRDDALAFGAKEFHVTRDFVPQTPVAPVQQLLWCRDVPPDFSKLIPQVACDGVIYMLSVGLQTVQVPMKQLVANGIRIQGLSGASRRTIRKMLQFVHARQIHPTIMTWPMTVEGIEDAFRTLSEGKMRYRGVLIGQVGQQDSSEV